MKILRKHYVYIYTDGSSKPKPRRGGIGVVYVYLDNNEKEIKIELELEGIEGATNNQMELSAAIEGLKRLEYQEIPNNYNNIEVRTDSMYVVQNINNAKFFWPKYLWKNKNGRPIENVKLWKQLLKQFRLIHKHIEFVWVKAHDKDIYNHRADDLAKKSTNRKLKPPLTVVKLRRQKSNKRIKAGSVDMKGQRIAIHIITEEYLKDHKLCKYKYEVISKKSDYYECADTIFSELKNLRAGHKYIVTFNKNNNNPRILRVIKELE